MKKRLTSLLLVLMLVLALLPAQPAWAAGLSQDEATADLTGEETLADVPGEAGETSTAPDEDPAEKPDVTAPEQGADSAVSVPEMALGSNGVRYKDVAYLSTAAFNSMPADARVVYTQTADEIAAMLDAGVELTNIVFSLDKDGTLNFTCSIPTNVLFTGLGDYDLPDSADYDLPDSANQTDFAAAVADDESVSDGLSTPIEENVELAESLKIPEEIIEGSIPLEDSMAILAGTGSPELDDLNTLFWQNKNYFYNQLSAEAKKYYNAGYTSMVVNGSNSFTTSASYAPNTGYYVIDGISALINTYPHKFDWWGWAGSGTSYSWSYYSGGYTVTTTIDKSKHYNASLETQAQAQVNKLVTAAYTYAKSYYPNNLTYGIIRYLDEWVCANNYYNYDGVNGSQSSAAYFYCHCSYGILLKGYGVCESYARAMSRLLDAAGIPNLYVVGDAGGGHAWNYVQMHNSSWYLLDSTWNDNGNSNRAYLLVRDDGVHKPTGMRYTTGMKFTFPARASTSYSYSSTTENAPTISSLTMNKSSLFLSKGQSSQLTAKVNLSGSNANGYYDSYYKLISWTSSNTKVATVDENGKVSAVGYGTAVITASVAGKSASCTISTYELSSLGFADSNNKSSLSDTLGFVGNPGDPANRRTYNLAAVFKGGGAPSSLTEFGVPDVDSSNPQVATATCTLTSNAIVLTVTPQGAGSANIKVTFGGKSATLKLKVSQGLDERWFRVASPTYGYTGSAIKADIISSAPAGVKYTVKYSNNKDIGTATVLIKGSGSYTGEVTLTFEITKYNLSDATVATIKDKAYNGKAQAPKVSIKAGKKALKEGKDFDITYTPIIGGSVDGSGKPVGAGTYTVLITARGNTNYTGSTTATYTITKASISKMKISMSSSFKMNGRLSATLSDLNFAVKGCSQDLVQGRDYTVEIRNAWGDTVGSFTEAGRYTVIVRPMPGSNFGLPTDKNTEITKTVTIK